MEGIDDDKFLINFYLDDEFKFNQLVKKSSTIEDLKKIILLTLNLYSINYKMEYNDNDIGSFDNFTLHQLFLFSKKEEYDIKLTNISTLKKYESQNILISIIEGDCWVYIYKLLTMKWQKVCPTMSERLSFYYLQKFPYNCRYCHIVQRNQLIITGGIDNETTACYYDADTNAVVDLPKMKTGRQRHAMVALNNEDVFIIGGVNCKKVTKLNVEYEDYTEYPELKYTRKDSSVCVVNNKYLYVFMGYCDETGGVICNYEKLDVSAEPYTEKWKILPLNNYYSLTMPRTYCAVVWDNFDEKFLFFGGSYQSSSQATVVEFKEDNYQLVKSKYILPLKANFSETMFLRENEMSNYYYLFTTGSEHELIRFNPKDKKLEEIKKECM